MTQIITPNMAAFTPVKYSLKLIELLYNDTIYPVITNTNYEGTIKESGDRVRVRTIAKISMSTYTKGMLLVKQEIAPTSEDMIIDQAKYFSFGVDDVDKIQNDINAITEYAATTKKDMAEVLDTDILSYGRKQVLAANMYGSAYSTGTISVAATTGVVTGSGTTFTSAMVGGVLTSTTLTASYLVTAYSSATAITVKDLDGVAYTGGAVTDEAYSIAGATALAVTKSNIYDTLVNLSTKLGTSLCPKEGRFIVVNSAFEGTLRKAPEFIPAVQSAYNSVVEKGLIGNIAGFKVITSELVDGNNSTGYWFIAGTKDFMSFATQISKVSVIPSEADPNSFISTCKGLLVWGRKVFAGNRARGAVLRCTLG
jgi:N4-gp56 family major capsid protein